MDLPAYLIACLPADLIARMTPDDVSFIALLCHAVILR